MARKIRGWQVEAGVWRQNGACTYSGSACPGGRRDDAHVADAGASPGSGARARSCACQWPRMQGECVTCSHIPGALRQRSSLSRTYPQPAARDLSTFTAMAFKGWPAEALEFYEGLEVDNSRLYWAENKVVYERAVYAPDGGPAGRPGGGVRGRAGSSGPIVMSVSAPTRRPTRPTSPRPSAPGTCICPQTASWPGPACTTWPRPAGAVPARRSRRGDGAGPGGADQPASVRPGSTSMAPTP